MRKRTIVAVTVAIVQVLLACNAVTGRSLTVDEFEKIGISNTALAGVLVAGALLLVLLREWFGFVLGSMPYLMYILASFSVVLQNRGGMGTLIIYAFSVAQMYLLYFCEEPNG